MLKRGRNKKYTAQNIFKDFRKRHPDMWRRGSNCRLVDHMKILIMAPGLGKFTYEWFPDKITWIEHWIDEKAIELAEKEMRPKYYHKFVCLLEDYMTETGVTQGRLAELAGVSRKSINEYLTGKSKPKIKTMRMICEKLGLKLDY